MNPGPETGFKARKFGFKARTKYGVYNFFSTKVKKLHIDDVANKYRDWEISLKT